MNSFFMMESYLQAIGHIKEIHETIKWEVDYNQFPRLKEIMKMYNPDFFK